jgi:uncharacterized spore protein YtfJ
MDVRDILATARGAMSAKLVFGEPFSKNGVTVIPAARVSGGAGGGDQQRSRSVPGGRGGGFGVTAKPAGVYILRGQQVRWMPAVDPNQIVAGFQLLAIVVFLALGRRRRRRGRFGGPGPGGRAVVLPAPTEEVTGVPAQERPEASLAEDEVPVR